MTPDSAFCSSEMSTVTTANPASRNKAAVPGKAAGISTAPFTGRTFAASGSSPQADGSPHPEQRPKRRQCRDQRFPFRTTACTTHAGNDGDFIEHQGRVFHKNRIRLFIEGGKRDDTRAQSLQAPFVPRVLRLRFRDVDRFAAQPGQFTPGE